MYRLRWLPLLVLLALSLGLPSASAQLPGLGLTSWAVVHVPAAGTQATASRAAAAAGIRHVANCISATWGATTAPTATQLAVNLIDGATGGTTYLWRAAVIAPATAAHHGSITTCGLNIVGTAATAMTLEFSASLASEFESVTLIGFDVM